MTFRAPLISPSRRGTKTLEHQVLGDERGNALTLWPEPPPGVPFSQTEWLQSPRRYQVGASSVVMNITLALVAAFVPEPFIQNHWDQPPTLRRVAQDFQPFNLALASPATPFSQSEWLALKRSSGVTAGLDPQNLFPLTVPAVGDLPLSPKAWLALPKQTPAAVPVYPQNLFPLTVNAVGELPLSPKEWLELPKSAPKSVTVYPQNALPLTAAPFASGEWLSLKLAKVLQSDLVTNLLATTLAPAPAAPFTQAYWAQPGGVRFVQVGVEVNLQSYTLAPLAVVDLPFTQTSWPLPPYYTAQNTYRQSVSPNLIFTPGLAPSAGSVVIAYSGVSVANGVSFHKGISRPNVALTDAGGGNFNVTITHSPHSETPGSLSSTTYLIDGELP